MTRQRLPIGIQDFRTIRSEGFCYVDKTPLIRRLVDEGRHYFLSRPRRFGKSLLLDTLRSLFACHKSLFEGIDIYPHWDWSAPHPVVRLSFGGKYTAPGDIERNALNQLAIIEHASDLDTGPVADTGPEHLQNILYRLHRATGRPVVVLVDEYDKPILDVLHDPDLARANRDYLRGFYGILKDSAEHVRFVFVTGVSMFSKVSLFSGLNNLEDISLDPRYAAICGYRDEDLDRVFAPELDGLDRDEIRTWYDGYRWRGKEPVYNPYDVLLLLDSREFRPWWFETGSPEFLFRMLMEQSVSPLELEGRLVERGREFCALLEAHDFAGFGATLRAWLAGIPYQWHATGDLARYEAWYASLLYLCLRTVGADLRVEEASARGRADMVLRRGRQVFVIEFKMAEGADGAEAALAAALAQMRGRGYADQYADHDGPVHLVGVACGCEVRNLLDIRAESV